MLNICRADNAFKPVAALRQTFSLSSPTLVSQVRQLRPSRRCIAHSAARLASPLGDQSRADSHEAYTVRHKDNIFPHSLTKTLEAHRAANRDSLVRRVTSRKTKNSKGLTYETSNGKNTTRNMSGSKDSTRKTSYKKILRPSTTESDKVSRSRSMKRVNSSGCDDGNSADNARRAAVKAPASPARFAGTPGEVATIQHDDEIIRSSVLHAGSLRQLGVHPSKAARQMPPRSSAPFLEYTGAYIPAAGTSKLEESVGKLDVPWLDRSTATESMDRLSQEIELFHAWMQPSRDEKTAKAAAISDVRAAVSKASDATLHLQGSEVTGLSLVTSDVDFRLALPEELESGKRMSNYTRRRRLHRSLSMLYHRLRDDERFVHSKYVWARYPLINLQHKGSGVDIQIVAATEISKSPELIRQYLEELPSLRQIYTVLKTILDLRGLRDTYRGGLGSYSLLILIVARLKLRSQEQYESSTLADDFLMVLSMFQVYFNNYANGLSLTPPVKFMKKRNVRAKKFKASTVNYKADSDVENGRNEMAVLQPEQPFLLCLQDPADPYNDLGGKAYAIKHVAATFNLLAVNLRNRLAQWQPDTKPPDHHLRSAQSSSSPSYGVAIPGSSTVKINLHNMPRDKLIQPDRISAPLLTKCIGLAPSFYMARRAKMRLFANNITLPALSSAAAAASIAQDSSPPSPHQAVHPPPSAPRSPVANSDNDDVLSIMDNSDTIAEDDHGHRSASSEPFVPSPVEALSIFKKVLYAEPPLRRPPAKSHDSAIDESSSSVPDPFGGGEESEDASAFKSTQAQAQELAQFMEGPDRELVNGDDGGDGGVDAAGRPARRREVGAEEERGVGFALASLWRKEEGMRELYGEKAPSRRTKNM